MRAAFELLLKDHDYIANLTKIEARDFYQMAAKEYRLMVKHSNDLEGCDLTQKAMEKSQDIKDTIDLLFDDLAIETHRRIMEESRAGYILKIADGLYISGITEVRQYCDKYNLELSLELMDSIGQVFAHIRNLEEVIQLLEARWRMPLGKQTSRKPEGSKIRTFRAACIGMKQYEAATKYLIDNKYCDPVSLAWIDKTGGHRSIMVLIIKDLIVKGYLHALSHYEIVTIAKNTFKNPVRIPTVKQPHILNYKPLPYFTE